MAENNDIQLLPESRKEIEVKVPGENKFLYVGVAILILVLVLFFLFNFYNKTLKEKVVSLDNQLIEMDKTRDKEAEKQILLANDQLKLVGGILNNHIIFSKLLETIQAKTAPQMQFKQLSVSLSKGEVIFSADTANYSIIARQIASYLSEPLIEDVKLNKVNTTTTGRLSLNMLISFKKDGFLLRASNQ